VNEAAEIEPGPAKLAQQRDGCRSADKDSILVGTEQAGEQDEVTGLLHEAYALAEEHPARVLSQLAS
jgi:hypothetical protein